MKKTKTTFLLAEICLGILLLFCVHLIFEDEKPKKRVAVIVEKSADHKSSSSPHLHFQFHLYCK